MKKLQTSHIVILIATMLIGCSLGTNTKNGNQEIPTASDKNAKIAFSTKPEAATFIVELARTEQEKSDGLMFRESLHHNSGMLFFFSSPQKLSFWMKNTLIALDIIFLDEKWQVVDIAYNMKPRLVEYTISKVNAKYALEINAGLASYYGIKVGTFAQFFDGK